MSVAENGTELTSNAAERENCREKKLHPRLPMS
jgi:hypothetical protein